MNTSRAVTGFLRKCLLQSRSLTVPTAPLVSRRCQTVHDIIQSPHKWIASEKMQFFSQPRSIGLTPKSSLFSSVASPEVSQKESNPVSSVESTVASKGEEIVEPVSQNQEPKKAAQRKESDSESEISSDEEKELSIEDLIRLVQEKEDLLKEKHKEIKVMQEKVLRSYAEVENVMDRARREAESTKKFAIQSFAKSLLDVADNLSRASSVVKESFSKIDPSKDSSGAAPLLKTLLEGVAMTEKQLSDVLKKHGVERFDPLNEQFDPNMHMAVFQVQDASKQPGSVAVVLKPGYTLHDRVIRPAEVGVVEGVESEVAGNSEPSA